MVGCSEETHTGLQAVVLSFVSDGAYSAYVVDSDAEIGSHYSKVATFNSWMKIYDDDSMVCRFEGKKINIFRSGNFGCIVQVMNRN